MSAPGKVAVNESSYAYAASVGNGYPTFCSPASLPLFSGTFTPLGPTVRVDVDITATVFGCASAGFTFYCGPTSLSFLTPQHQGDGLQAGVTSVSLGQMPAQLAFNRYDGSNPANQNVPHAPLTFKRSFYLTGLTPGAALNWEISPGIIGNLQSVTGFSGPSGLNVSTLADPDQYLYAVVKNVTPNPATVQIVKIGNAAQHPRDTLLGSALAMRAGAGTAGGVAISRDASVAACVNQSDANPSVSIITGILTGSPTIQGTYNLPQGAGSNSFDAAFSNDASTLYISVFSSNVVQPMTVSNGTFGTAISVGTNPARMRLSPDGTKLAVSNQGAGTVTIINVPANTVAGTTTVLGASNSNPGRPGFSPDSATLYVPTSGASQHKVWPVTVSNLSVGTALNIDTLTGETTTPRRCDVTGDGKTLFVFNNNANTHNVIQITLANSQLWANWYGLTASTDTFGEGAILPDGGIVTTDTTTSTMFDWPSASLWVRSGAFHQEQANVSFSPA